MTSKDFIEWQMSGCSYNQKKYYNQVLKDLDRLEKIDNAKPSEALEWLEKSKNMMIENNGDFIAFECLKVYSICKQALIEAQEQNKILENLKDPYDEYETEDYLCTRQAYYNNNLGELCFAYTIYKWDGTYKEHKASILKTPLKMKNWVEVFHTGCGTGKKELNDEYIQDYLKLKEIMKKEVVKK